jgi:hypothetical protein
MADRGSFIALTLRFQLGEGVEELLHGPAGVNDVLDDEDVLSSNRGFYVLHPDDSDFYGEKEFGEFKI